MPAKSKKKSASVGLELHEFVKQDEMGEVRRLLQDEVRVNEADSEGETALHFAAEKANVPMMKLLIRFHADVNAVDKEGRTPFMMVPNDRTEVRDVLLQAGAIAQADYYEADQPNKDLGKAQVENPGIETTDVVNPKMLRKCFVMFLVPFIVLLFSNGLYFAIKFTAFSTCFYFICIGYLMSELTIKPPWYHHHPGLAKLTVKGLPTYWVYINNPHHNLGLDYEDVQFASSGGYTLSGWFVPGNNKKSNKKKKLGIIMVHGGGRDRRAWLRHLPIFHEEGYDCLLFDLREHGLSSGANRGFTYGMSERYDVKAAAQFMRGKAGVSQIAALGTSVGGSSVIMAAAIDPTIDIVIAENPILTCAHLQDTVIVDLFGGYMKGTMVSRLVLKMFRKTCMFWLNIRVGNKPSKRCQAMHMISKISPRPVLLMHGTYDDVVPPYHSERLFELANDPKELWLVPEGVHCNLFNKDPEGFKKKVLGFLEKYQK